MPYRQLNFVTALVPLMRDSAFDYNDPCKNNALCESINDPLTLLKTNGRYSSAPTVTYS